MRAELQQTFLTHADRIALRVEGGVSLTYGDLHRLGDSICAELSHPRGMVMIRGGNDVHTIAAYTGALRHGHVVYLVDAADPIRQQDVVERYRPDAVITCDAQGYRVENSAAHGGDIAPDIAILFSTSGSTGSPKLVKITAQNILSNTRSIVEYLGLREDDCAVTLLQPFYSFGLSIINSHLLIGASLLLTDRSIHDPSIWQVMADNGVTSFSGVPHTFEVCAPFIAEIGKVATLRHVTQAGGKLSRDLVKTFAAAGAQQGWRFFVMYGQTEASPRISYLPPEDAAENPESIGVAVPGGRLEVEAEDGTSITEPGQEGELIYFGPNVMAGYAADRSDLAFVEPRTRLATGDIAYRKPNGLIVITGRKSRFIKPMGLRIGLDDVEERLKSLGYRMAATADGDRLIAHVEHPAGATAADIGKALNLAPGFIRVRFVEALPRLSNDKVDYSRLQVQQDAGVGLPPWREPLQFLSAVLKEAVGILLGTASAGKSVYEAYREILGVPEIMPSDTFVSLGGDSMRYVECSVYLEQNLQDVPRNWHLMTVAALEDFRTGVL